MILVEAVCDACRDWPCRCPKPVTVRCQCGLTLTASDDLEHKRLVAAAHTSHPQHVAWRWRLGAA